MHLTRVHGPSSDQSALLGALRLYRRFRMVSTKLAAFYLGCAAGDAWTGGWDADAARLAVVCDACVAIGA